jgi:hypothetical protein
MGTFTNSLLWNNIKKLKSSPYMTFFDSVRLKNEMIALYFSSELEMKPLYQLVQQVNASNIYELASLNVTIPSNTATV